MATFNKVQLSGSTGGQPILVAQTATAGTLIHTTGTSSSVLDEVWLYAYNDHTADLLLTIEYGGVTSPNNLIRQTVTTRAGLILVAPGLLLAGDGTSGRNIRAFAASANLVTIVGFVNRIS